MSLTFTHSSKSESKSHTGSFPFSPHPSSVESSSYISQIHSLPSFTSFLLPSYNEVSINSQKAHSLYSSGISFLSTSVSSINFCIPPHLKKSPYLHDNIHYKFIWYLVKSSGTSLMQKSGKRAERHEYSPYLIYWLRMSVQFLVKTIEGFKIAFLISPDSERPSPFVTFPGIILHIWFIFPYKYWFSHT